MTGNTIFGGLLLLFMICMGTFALVHGKGYDKGVRVTRTETITFCIERPKDCRLEYDFNKMKENDGKISR